METRRPIATGGTPQEIEAAMQALAQNIREAGECLLDLEQALEMLRLAREPALAMAVHVEAAGCLRRAMQRANR